MGQEDSNYWHFDNIFCRLNGYRKVIILEAIYQQSEKVQYQRQLTTTVKTNIFQRQITNTRFVRCYAPSLQAQAENSRIRQILVLFTAKINGNDQKQGGD